MVPSHSTLKDLASRFLGSSFVLPLRVQTLGRAHSLVTAIALPLRGAGDDVAAWDRGVA